MSRNARGVRVLVLSNMSPSPRNPGWGAFVAGQVDSLRALGLKVTAITRTVPSRWRYPAFYVAALRAVLDGDHNIVHAHYGFHSALPAMLIRSCPLVVTFHRGDALDEPARNRGYRALQRACVRAAQVVVTVSEELRQAVVECLDADPGKVRVIPCGIDPTLFQPANPQSAQYYRRDIRPTVLWSGSDSSAERKGLSIALAVARRLPEVSFVFLGVTEPRSAPLNCRFPGRVSNEELPRWLNSARLFFLPSLSEGTPVSLLEAMAAGTLVLASPVGGIPEVVSDGQDGFHLSSREVNVATDQISAILELPDETVRVLTAAARTRVLSKYSATAVATQLSSIYSELLA